MAKYMTENELYHHGILGQKWGVRRFQNQDGSYTAAGKERYGIEDGKRRSLKSYALEYKDRRENKNRYSRMKKNQNLDTMSFDEMKRLQEREALKGQIQWQQQKNDPNSWKKEFRRELMQTAAKSIVSGAGQELGKQLINAPVRFAAFAGNKTVNAAGWSARELVSVATDTRRQAAVKNTFNTIKDTGRYLNNPGYRSYKNMAERNGVKPTWADYNKRSESVRQQMASRKWNQEHNVLALPDRQNGIYSYPSSSAVKEDARNYRNPYRSKTTSVNSNASSSTSRPGGPTAPTKKRTLSVGNKFTRFKNQKLYGEDFVANDPVTRAYWERFPKNQRPLAFR